MVTHVRAEAQGDERGALLSFLAEQRGGIRRALLGLTDEQAAAKPSASELTLAGLLKHVVEVEQGWVARAKGEPPAVVRTESNWGAHEWSNAKPGSIYHALKQMARQGLLHAHEIAPSTAGGPPRTEYEITEAGTEEYLRLVREALTSYDQKTDVKAAAIGFIVDLPRGEAVALLKERIRRIEEWRSTVTEQYVPENGPEQLGHIGEIMNLWVHTADAEAEWTQGLIARVEDGAYTFAGEGDPFVGVLAQGEENPYATGERHPEDTH